MKRQKTEMQLSSNLWKLTEYIANAFLRSLSG